MMQCYQLGKRSVIRCIHSKSLHVCLVKAMEQVSAQCLTEREQVLSGICVDELWFVIVFIFQVLTTVRRFGCSDAITCNSRKRREPNY